MHIVKNDNQFLTFYVSDEIYALSVLNIKEIIEYSKVTKVPLMDSCISGITNIRGSVIPLINLAERMHHEKNKEINKRTSIIVIEKEDPIKNFQVGLIVDEVNKVYEILNQEQEDAPTFGSKIRKEYIEHIAKINGTFIPILNSDHIVNIEELSQIIERDEI